jgi:hypothetical protein
MTWLVNKYVQITLMFAGKGHFYRFYNDKKNKNRYLHLIIMVTYGKNLTSANSSL